MFRTDVWVFIFEMIISRFVFFRVSGLFNRSISCFWNTKDSDQTLKGFFLSNPDCRIILFFQNKIQRYLVKERSIQMMTHQWKVNYTVERKHWICSNMACIFIQLSVVETTISEGCNYTKSANLVICKIILGRFGFIL